MEPVTAIANAAGSLFDAIGEGLNVIGLGTQKKIVQEQGENLDKVTEQTEIQSRTTFLTNLFGLVSQENSIEANNTNTQNRLTTIIIGSTFAMVLLIIILKSKKK